MNFQACYRRIFSQIFFSICIERVKQNKKKSNNSINLAVIQRKKKTITEVYDLKMPKIIFIKKNSLYIRKKDAIKTLPHNQNFYQQKNVVEKSSFRLRCILFCRIFRFYFLRKCIQLTFLCI